MFQMSEKSHHGSSNGFSENNIHATVCRIQTAHTKGDWRNTQSMKTKMLRSTHRTYFEGFGYTKISFRAKSVIFRNNLDGPLNRSLFFKILWRIQ